MSTKETIKCKYCGRQIIQCPNSHCKNSAFCFECDRHTSFVPQPTLSQCCGAEKIICNHFQEHCSKCHKTFIPKEKNNASPTGPLASTIFDENPTSGFVTHEKECKCKLKPCKHDNMTPLPKEDWMDKEREAFIDTFDLGPDIRQETQRGIWYKNIIAYWLYRIQSQIEAERERCNKEWTEKYASQIMEEAIHNFREQGRVEERERIVKMIEEEYPLADNKTRRLLKELLANLTSNEKDIKK